MTLQERKTDTTKERCAEEEHNKLYSGEYFATNPPKWMWVCTECGETGCVQSDIPDGPVDLKCFAEAMIQFHGEGHVGSSGIPYWKYVLENLV